MRSKMEYLKTIKNEKGMTILPILLFGIGAVILFSSFSIFFDNNNKLQAKARIVEEAANLSTTVKMMFSTPANCTENLKPQAFGQNIQQLRSKSANNSIRMFYSTGNGNQGNLMIASNSNFYQLPIAGISFNNTTPDPQNPFAYNTELQITIKDGLTNNIKPITIPFVMVTNSGTGQIESCYATSYSPTDPAAPPTITNMTIENALCNRLEPGTFYLPQEKSCVSIGTSVVGI